MRANEIIIRAEQRPGEASFHNYNEIKEYLDSELLAYRSKEYSLANFREAETDLRVLRAVRKKLYDKKKELETAYKMPINEVIGQLDELIRMVKEPMDILDRFIKSHEKEIKEQIIYEYAEQKGSALGKYAEKVINSPAFFNPRWRNKSYSERVWKQDVDKIIRDATGQIETILVTGGEHKNALLAFYFEKLSMEGLGAFYETLTKGVEERPQVKEESSYDDSSEEPYTVDPKTGEVFYSEPAEGSELTTLEEEHGERPADSGAQIVSKLFRLTGTEEQLHSYIDTAVGFSVQVQELYDSDIILGASAGSSSGSKKRSSQRKGRAGAPWSDEEDEQLKKEFARGDKVSQIAQEHQRSYGAIQARLEKLGLVGDSLEGGQEEQKENDDGMPPWFQPFDADGIPF